MSPAYLRSKLRRLGHAVPPELDAEVRKQVREERRAKAAAKLKAVRHMADELAANASLALEELRKASPLPTGGEWGRARFLAIMNRGLREWMRGEQSEAAERRRKHQREWARRKSRANMEKSVENQPA